MKLTEKTKNRLIAWSCVVGMLLVIGGLFDSFIGVSLWHDKNAKSPLHKNWVKYLRGETDKKPEPITVYIYCSFPRGKTWALTKEELL